MSIYPVFGSPSRHPPALPPQTWLSPNRGQKLLAHPLPHSPSKLAYPEKKPIWYDQMHRLLRDLRANNQDEPLDPMDREEIRDTVARVIETGDDGQALLFLKLLSEYPLYGSQEVFFTVLGALRSHHPDLNAYFKDVDLDEDGLFPSFSIQAIEQVLRFFSAEYHFPPEVWSVATASALPVLVREMIHGPNNTIQAWAVSNDLKDEDPHVIPVFALKKEGILHLFFFDSVGHTIPGSPQDWRLGGPLLHLLDELQNAPEAYDKLQVYSYGPPRQFAPAGCVTFSLLDLKNLVEMHLKWDDDLVRFYECQSPHLQPFPVNERLRKPYPFPVYEIETLPPQMMKSTQSYTELRKYEERRPTLGSVPMTTRTSAIGEIYSKPQDFDELRHRVAEAKRMDTRNRSKNLYVEQKSMQFTVYLLGTYFGVQTIPPETICTPQPTRRRLTYD